MKRPTRNLLIMVVLALQVVALAWVAIQREWIRNSGETVFLRTAPVDPRDMFRGDYVQLDYEIAQPDQNLLPEEWKKSESLNKLSNQKIYLKLERDAHGVGQLTGIFDEQPDGLFIKGYFNPNDWRSNSFLKLGIEKYFLEQDTGLALEQQRGRSQDWQTPMEMDVALGGDGTAVIRGHRWSDLGIRLEVLEAGLRDNRATAVVREAERGSAPPPRRSPKLRISVRNQSQKNIILVDSVEHGAFRLVTNQSNIGRGQTYQLVATPGRPQAEEAKWLEHSLSANAIYSFEIDLSGPPWLIEKDGKLQEIGDLQNQWEGYRFIYQLPESERKARAQQKDTWLSTLRTARFFGSGRID